METSGCRALKPYVAKDTSRAIPDDGEFGKERAYMIDIAFASEQGEVITDVILMLMFFFVCLTFSMNIVGSSSFQMKARQQFIEAQQMMTMKCQKKLYPFSTKSSKNFQKCPFCVRFVAGLVTFDILLVC